MRPLTWNADRSVNRTRLFVGWHNWLDQSGWRALDGGFREDSGRYVADQIPGVYSVPALATGSVEFEVSQRYDIFQREAITEAPWSLEITPANVRPVSAQRDDDRPDRILYPDAFGDGIDLRYTVWLGRGPRVTREIVIRREPPGDHDLRGSWLLRTSRARAYVRADDGQLVRPWAGRIADKALAQGRGVILRAGTSADNESLLRGSGIRDPKAWYYKPDGEMVSTPITLEFEIVATNTVRATKIIPRTFVREAFAAGATAVMSDDTSTFYPDPHSETTSVDGYLKEGSAQSWSDLRSAAGSGNYDSSSPLIIGVYSNATTDFFYNMHRAMCLFDRSALPGNIVSGTFGGTYYTHAQTYPEAAGVALCESTPASNTDLVNGDYSQFGSTRFCDSDVMQGDWSGTMTWDLNAAGLAAANAAGDIVKLGLRLTSDLDDSAPTWTANGKQSVLQIRSAENAFTASDPYLEVTTGAAAGASPALSRHSLSLGTGL